jgi:hypothetical protein
MADALFESNTGDAGKPADWSFFVAYRDLSDYQYHIVSQVSKDAVDYATTATVPLGILQNKPKIGQVAIVRVDGVSKLRVSAAGLDVGDHYGSDATGHGIAKTADKNMILGEVLMAAEHVLHRLATVTVKGGVRSTISKTDL